MSRVSKTFSAASQYSPIFLLRQNQTGTYSVTGTYSGTVVLQRSDDGTNWVTVATASSVAVSETVINSSHKSATFRWLCSAYASGSPVVTIADSSDSVLQLLSGDGGTALTVDDDGATVPSLLVSHESVLSTGEIASTVINTVTATLSDNESNSAFATLSVLQPLGAAGSPSYFTSSGAEIQVPAVDTNYLADSTLYGGKFIINFDTSATSGTCIAYLIALESELILKASNASGDVTYANVYNLLVANEPFTQTGGGDVYITDYRGIYVEALSLGARFNITNHWNLYVEDTQGGSYFGAPILVIGAATPIAGGVAHRGAGGIRTESASTQDGMRLLGRAGGTGSFSCTLTCSALTSSSKTVTFPNANLTFAATTSTNTVTQLTSRTTGVTLNAIEGNITLVSAAGSSAWNSFTVTNSSVGANDKITVNVKTATDIYLAFVTTVSAGSFKITCSDLTGATVESPVLTFIVHKFTAS